MRPEDGRIAILAGNHFQYLEHLKENFSRTKQNTVYIYSEEQLRGCFVIDIEVVGTFWDRPDAEELYNYANLLLKRQGD